MKSRNAMTLTWAACALLGVASTPRPESQQRGATASRNGVLDVVVDEETGNRLSGAVVTVPGYRSMTGLGGVCRFGLAPGRYAVVVSKSGYRGRTVDVRVRPGETTTTRVRLQKLASRGHRLTRPGRNAE